MSGVLERMAKRALGALPTVHPLLAPQFAPADRTAREALLQLEAPLDVDARLEVDASDSRDAPPRPCVRQKVDDRERPDPEHHRTFEQVAALSTSARETPPARTDDRQSQDHVLPLQPPVEHRVVDLQVIARPNPVDEPPVSLEPARQVRQTGGELQWQTDLRNPGTLIIPREHFPDTMPDDPLDLVHENQTRRLPAKYREEPRSERQPASVPTTRIEQAVRSDRRGAVALVRSAEQKAEIHISIGRIELRAPQAQATPSAASYRPRVTLEDFLRRKPEASG